MAVCFISFLLFFLLISVIRTRQYQLKKGTLFDTLSVLAVGRVKLVMQMDILFGFSAADKICIFLQHMILVVTHVSDRQDQTQP